MKILKSPVRVNTWANMKGSITIVLVCNFLFSTVLKSQMHKNNYKSMLLGTKCIKMDFMTNNIKGRDKAL